MNKSSSVLSEQDRNVSSFFNESCESITRCCNFRQKYEDCYREMSQTRIESRNLRQENTVLCNTLRGTQEENAVLKNILASKKEIIAKLNREAVASNQQISRLEDELHALAQQYQEQLSVAEDVKEECRVLREENRALAGRCERLVEERHRLGGDNERMKQEQARLREECAKEVQRVTQERQIALAQAQQTFLKKLEQLGNFSPTKTAKNTSILTHKENTISVANAKDLDMSLASFKQRQQQQEGKYEQLLKAKDAQIRQLSKKVADLEGQMSESMELFEHQISQSQQLKQALTQQQQQAEASETTRNRLSEREQLFQSVAKRIAAMLKSTLIDQSDLIDRLMAALPLGKKFELEVLMKEAESSCEVACRNVLRNAIGSKQYEQASRAIEELRQDYQLLQLKHATLQREYEEIRDDNQRLIKYNHLSRYRLTRNSQPLESTPCLKRQEREQSANKENMPSTINH